MCKYLTILLTAFTVLSLNLDGSDAIIARGGGRGGGGGRASGGGSRVGNAGGGRASVAKGTIQRTPTMSRAGAAVTGAAVARSRTPYYYPTTSYYDTSLPNYILYPQTGYPPY
jgi:hypothetical protein